MYNYSLERLRDQEFPHLADAVYVDHAGTTLFSRSQMDAIHKDLTSNLYGNPHSHNYSSKLTSDLVDQMRYKLLTFFGASPDEYNLIFTSGCTAALKLVASTFDFKHNVKSDEESSTSSGVFCFLQDNHTSVQGMRGQAMQSGVPAVCLDETEFESALNKNSSSSSSSSSSSATSASLFAFPAQSNFSGKRYPLSWIKQVQQFGLDLTNVRPDMPSSHSSPWYVLLDAASLVSTSPLHLGREDVKPDFVTVSFYKIFGYPTGLGALLVHRRASHLLRKDYFGGGTVAASTSTEPFQMFRKVVHERFEDGTLPFLDIIGLRHGLDTVRRLAGGMDAVSKHVFCVAQFFHHHLTRLRHGNGQPLAVVYGDLQFQRPEDQGGIVTFNLLRADGSFIGYAEVDKFAQLHDVHLRTGCFCNIGACQKYLHLSSKTIKDNYDTGHVCGDNMDLIDGIPTGAIRISFGYMSTVDDAKACLRFITDSFLEDVSPMPSFPYPQWYQGNEMAGILEGSKKGEKPSPTSVKSNESSLHALGNQQNVIENQINITGNQPISQECLIKGSQKGVKENQMNVSGSHMGMRITDIFLYPIKSCGAFRVPEWEVGPKGLLYDREWIVVSDTGVVLGQRREPKICLICPHIDLSSQKLILQFPNASPFELPLEQEGEALAMANLCNNKVCGDRVNTFDCGDAVADWLSNALLRPGIRLLRQQSQDGRTSRQTDRGAQQAPGGTDQRLSLANESQMLIVNRASVRALQEKMVAMGDVDEAEDSKMPTAPQDISEDNLILRFRCNLVVAGESPFEEEGWTSLGVKDNTIVCQNMCSRCSMICVDQATGQRSREPLRTLAMWRGKKVPFGIHSRMVPLPDGKRQWICVGDPVKVED